MTVLAVDAGTTTVRCVAVDGDGRPVGEERLSLPPANPAPGLVEFDALVLAEAVVGMATEVLERHGPVDGVGIASQRASAVAWDRSTGQPVGPGIGWQDLRTVARCGELRAEGVPVAPNQSATKFEWLMGEGGSTSGADLCLGTVDSWLAWVLTGAAAHVTDVTNASATGLLASDGSWDTALLGRLSIPVGSLPELVGSAGAVAAASILPGSPVISAMVGDQQASLIGLGCVSAGQTKLTAGTGAMVDMCTGDVAGTGADGCYAMPAWAIPEGVVWMLEGAVLSAGSAVAWLVDLGVVPDVASSHALASGCQEACQAGGTGRVGRYPGVVADQAMGLGYLRLGRHHGRTAVFEHCGHDRLPVVDDVVEDARGQRARVVPRPHDVGVIGAGDCREGIVELRHKPEGAVEGCAALGLDGVQRWPVSQDPQVSRLGKGLDRGAGQGASADLDEQSTGLDPGAGSASQVGGQLEPEGPPAVDGHQVLGSLAGERDRTVGDQFPGAQNTRIADLVQSALADDHAGTQVVEFRQHGGICPCRNVDGERPVGRPSDYCGGQGGVATGCDDQRGAGGCVVHLEVEGQPEQVPGLVCSRDVAGLVLSRQVACMADGGTDRAQVDKRRVPEPVAVDLGHGVIESAHDVKEGCVVDPCLDGPMMGPEHGPVANERVGVGVQCI